MAAVVPLSNAAEKDQGVHFLPVSYEQAKQEG